MIIHFRLIWRQIQYTKVCFNIFQSSSNGLRIQQIGRILARDMNKENKPQKLFIKNMVCQRCIMTVESILGDLKIPFTNVALGEVTLPSKLDEQQLKEVEKGLK